jgi:hypothetical protein
MCSPQEWLPQIRLRRTTGRSPLLLT